MRRPSNLTMVYVCCGIGIAAQLVVIVATVMAALGR